MWRLADARLEDGFVATDSGGESVADVTGACGYPHVTWVAELLAVVRVVHGAAEPGIVRGRAEVIDTARGAGFIHSRCPQPSVVRDAESDAPLGSGRRDRLRRGRDHVDGGRDRLDDGRSPRQL